MESRHLTALLLVPVALQPIKGTLLPHVGPQDWAAQSVALTTHSPGQVSTCVFSLFPLSPLSGICLDLIALLPFLPDYVCIFLTVLVVWESFCQFSVIIVPRVDVFLMCSWREVSSTFSYSAILIYPGFANLILQRGNYRLLTTLGSLKIPIEIGIPFSYGNL